MTDSAIIAIAAALSIAFSTIGPRYGTARPPPPPWRASPASPTPPAISGSSLIISMAMMEALTIYGLLIAFMLVAKV